MQKQRCSDAEINYLDENLNDDFPIHCNSHTQRHSDLNYLHYHSSFEIGLCVKGSGVFFIGNELFSFSQNDVSFIFPNQPHIAQSPDEVPSQWYFIMLDLPQLLLGNSKQIDNIFLNETLLPKIISKAANEDIMKLAAMLIDELLKKERGYQEAVKEILSLFTLKLLRLSDECNQRVALSNTFSLISPALTYLSKSFGDNITSGILARKCNLSETHFRTVFKKATGNTPMQYVVNIRMRMAKTLLKSTKLSVLEISQSVGFQTISSFNRFFKQQFGVTPSEYRV